MALMKNLKLGGADKNSKHSRILASFGLIDIISPYPSKETQLIVGKTSKIENQNCVGLLRIKG